MAPGAKVLEAELAKAVDQLWHSADRSKLTVNSVRALVEKKLHLEGGFFKQAEWKERSKVVIKTEVDQLEAAPQTGETTSSQAPASSQNGQKRGSPDGDESTPSKKRQKTTSTTVTAPAAETKARGKATKPMPKPKTPAVATKAKRKSKAASSEEDEDDLSDADSAPTPKKPAPSRARKPVAGKKSYREKSTSGEEDEEKDEEPDADQKVHSSPVAAKPAAKTRNPAVAKAGGAKKAKLSDDDSPLSELNDDESDTQQQDKKPPAVEDNQSSELSSLEDDSPKPKSRKKASDKSNTKPKSKPNKPSATTASDVPAGEAEVKKLQGQLAKCGIRKIWGFELKKYGDDSGAKIRHLRQLLQDAGMDGRFSEAKAREVKERRELEADLAAVTEMNNRWGMDGGRGRASRTRATDSKKRKHHAEDDADDVDEDEKEAADDGKADGDEDGDDEDAPRARGRGSTKYRADLAFLDDESESD